MLKKLLALLLVLVCVSPVFGKLVIKNEPGGKFGFELEKSVNGGYKVSMPVDLNVEAQVPFLPKAYLKSQAVFTGPRGNVINALQKLNHSNFDMVLGGGFTLLNGKLEVETGATYWWDGNDGGVPEGWEWTNAARYYFEF